MLAMLIFATKDKKLAPLPKACGVTYELSIYALLPITVLYIYPYALREYRHSYPRDSIDA